MADIETPVNELRLGKKPARVDPRTLQLASYIGKPLPNPPKAIDLTKGVRGWPMYGNDKLGDCTCAAAGHMIEVWTAEQADEIAVPQQSVIQMYNAITGGVDEGAVELDVLRYWKAHGLAGHAPFAYAAVAPTETLHVRQAANLFGGVYIGIALPKSAQAQTGNGRTWAFDAGPDGEPGSWGGHAVNIVAYDGAGLTCVTWGMLQKMSWAFWEKYVDECWAVLPADWETKAPKIKGFDWTAFQKDLDKVGKATK